MTRTEPRVFITGAGCVLPTGSSPQALWDAALEGRSALTRYDSPWHRCSWLPWYGRVAESETQAALQSIPAKLKRFCSETTAWGLQAASQALASAALEPDSVAPHRRGLFTAEGGNRYPAFHCFLDWVDQCTDGQGLDLRRFAGKVLEHRRQMPFVFIKSLRNNLLAIASSLLQYKGDCGAYAQDDGGAVAALRNALFSLRHGYSDLALVICSGSADEAWNLCERQALKQLSRGDDGIQSLRPYDRRRDGMVPGEGAVALLLESESLVQRRGATPLAELVTVASRVAAPSEGRRRDAYAFCLEQVLRTGRLAPAEIGAVCANGKGLPMGDRYELRMLEYALGPLAPELPVTCATALTGVISAAGVLMDVLLCLEMLRQSTVPPVAHLEEPEFSGVNLCRERPMAYAGHHALAFNFNLSGFYAATLLRKP